MNRSSQRLCAEADYFPSAASGLHGSSGKLTGSTSSLNKLAVQTSNSRRSQSSSLLDMGNMSASDLDVADRTKFDKVVPPVPRCNFIFMINFDIYTWPKIEGSFSG